MHRIEGHHSRHLLPPISRCGKTVDIIQEILIPVEVVGLPTERERFPVPEKGQFFSGKRGAKATQSDNYMFFFVFSGAPVLQEFHKKPLRSQLYSYNFWL